MTTDGTEPQATGRSEKKPGWRKAKLPTLNASSTAEEALSGIVLSCVEHLRGNEACVLARSHEEGIHQMRVAVRRLRSCIALYAPLVPPEQFGYLNGELKWLIGELGPARDWDVFVDEVMGPVVRQMADEDRLELLSEHVERRRDEAYAVAQEAVSSPRYLGLVLLFASWAEGRGWHDAGAGERSPAWTESAADFATGRLRSIYGDLLAAGEGFDTLDAKARHKVRIQLKKLRYASEFFSSLYAKRKVSPYLAAMKTLQDDLGTSNDRDVAKKLLKRVTKAQRGKERAQLAYAAGLVVGWHSHVGDNREQELIRAWHRFVARPPYWQFAGDGSSAGAEEEPAPAATDADPEDASPTAAAASGAGGSAGGAAQAGGIGDKGAAGSAAPARRITVRAASRRRSEGG